MIQQNVHHVYTMCTPITKYTSCTIDVQLMYNYLYTLNKVLIKILYKGYILRSYIHVVAKSFLRRRSIEILFREIENIVQVRRCPERPGFRGGFGCSLPGAFALTTQTGQS